MQFVLQLKLRPSLASVSHNHVSMLYFCDVKTVQVQCPDLTNLINWMP